MSGFFLLHLTKAAVTCLNSTVHSTNLRLFSIERFLFFCKKQAISVIPSMTYRLCAVLSSHMLYRMPKSRIGARPWMTFRSVPLYLIPAGFHVCWHSRQGGVGVRCAGKWQFPFFLLQMGIDCSSLRDSSASLLVLFCLVVWCFLRLMLHPWPLGPGFGDSRCLVLLLYSSWLCLVLPSLITLPIQCRTLLLWLATAGLRCGAHSSPRTRELRPAICWRP